ncbi:MAG: response regulator [Dehalococcoidales bacterium]|nr:response regulator [Dehalococcoidales bacterium]
MMRGVGVKVNMNILIIEDNPGDVRLVQEMIKEAPSDKFTINAVDRLEAGLEFLNSHKVDVVLADLGLPDSSGVKTLNRLQPHFQQLPIIVTTSIDDEALAVRAVRQGAADYLVKGQMDARLLRHSILYAIERKRMERELTWMRDELEIRVQERTAELCQAEQELRSLSNRLIDIQEEERRDIARELHDQTGQSLTMVKLLLARVLKSPPDKAPEIINEAAQQVSEVINQVRNLSLALRPSMLDDLGLVPALTWLLERVGTQSGLSVGFDHDELQSQDVSSRVNTTAYRIVQEALTNIVRHSGASRAKVCLHTQGDVMSLNIEDDGRGFDMHLLAIGTSNGLSGMRERTRLLGGTFTIESTPGTGTHITVKLPISAPKSQKSES